MKKDMKFLKNLEVYFKTSYYNIYGEKNHNNNFNEIIK